MRRTTTLIVGCGYLGARVGKLLAEKGDRVLGTTRSPGRFEELSRLGIEPVMADVMRPDGLGGLPEADRALYCVGFDRSSGSTIRNVYVDGLRNALGRLFDRVGSLVYASSTGVYGGDDGGWVDEDTPADPRTESGRACLDAEGVIRSYGDAGRLRGTILRLAGLYGPGRILRRETIAKGLPIVGDPEKILNLVQVDDAATATIAALDRGRSGTLYLVADDHPAPRREFYRAVAEAIGAPEPRFEPPEPGSPEASREGSNKRVKNARIKAELGWTPAYPDAETGVRASIAAEGAG